MRVALVFSLLVALCMSGTALAQNSASLVTGSFNCHDPLPCSQSDASFPSSSALATMANACVGRQIAIAHGMSAFDDTAGVNANGCLTTNPAAFPSQGRVTTIPQCCITKLLNNSCVFHCNIYAQ